MAVQKKEIDEMTPQERLWSSLDYSYGEQREDSRKTYARAKSEADRRALSRGMQRSLLNEQVQANLEHQSAEALNRIYAAQNAAYAAGLNQLEQQEADKQFRERQFAETQAQNAWNRSFQESEAQRAAEQFNLQFNASREDAEFNKNMQEQQFAANQDQTLWQRGFQESEAQRAADQFERQFSASREDAEFNKNLQQQQFAAEQEQNLWLRGFQEGEAQRAADQFERQFGQTEKTTEQQIAMGYVQTALANGQIPGDDLLARAGLTREDAQLMVKKTYSGGGTVVKKPWDQLGLTEAQYNAMLAKGLTPNAFDVDAFIAALSKPFGDSGNTSQDAPKGTVRPYVENNKFKPTAVQR